MPRQRPAFEAIALLLQGGGALGAYQAGVYEALAAAEVMPTWVAGISIGAINAAIIAGNPPETRVSQMRGFWEQITSTGVLGWDGALGGALSRGDVARGFSNQISAGLVLTNGVAGFFKPRLPPPLLHPIGSLEATSYYDTGDLKATLERFVDFDRINAAEMRFSVGAVNVRSGNFVYFDTETHKIRAEHVMASGALPPGFPAIEIEGEYYWDGGLVSNTPLQWVIENGPSRDTLIFQVDLWNARGDFPRNMAEVTTRQKEIQYSSRTRANTDWFRKMKKLRCALADLLEKLPEELRDTAEVKLLSTVATRSAYNIVHLIYRAHSYEGDSKDYEFSRQTMIEHWRAGLNDARRTLRHSEIFEHAKNVEILGIFDLVADGRD
jgi:NTE family protein